MAGTIIIGPLCVTVTNQGAGAPLADRCWTREKGGGRVWRGRAILLTPWRRDRYGASLMQKALVVGWLHRPAIGSAVGPERAA